MVLKECVPKLSKLLIPLPEKDIYPMLLKPGLLKFSCELTGLMVIPIEDVKVGPVKPESLNSELIDGIAK